MHDMLAMPPFHHRPPTIRANHFLSLCACVLVSFIGLGAVAPAAAQLVDNPDWKETEAPPPPAFDPARVVEIEMPSRLTLNYGVDPDTIRITGDGIVRYVVVASNRTGAMNAFYEGVRCATAEMKTYARFTGGEWHPVENPDWQKMRDMSSPHASELARQGLCRGRAPRQTPREIVQYIKRPIREVE